MLRSLIVPLLLSSSVHAGIVGPEDVRLGEPIILEVETECDPPDGQSMFSWYAVSPGCSLQAIASTLNGTEPVCRKAHVWAVPGDHKVEVVVAKFRDGRLLPPERHVHKFRVSGAPPPPTPATLRDLVTPEQAATLADMYAALSRSAKDGAFRDAELFFRTQKILRDRLDLQGAEEAYRVIDEMIETAIVPFSQEALHGVLAKVASELGGDLPPGPEPDPDPDPDSGARRVVVVTETENTSVPIRRLIVQLRMEGTARDYIEDNGHSLEILDDEAATIEGDLLEVLTENREEINKIGLPLILIIDPKTNRLLFSRGLDQETTADNVVEWITRTGG